MAELAERLSARFGGAPGVLLQLGRRGGRGRAQVRAQGDREARGSSRSRTRSTDARSARSPPRASRPSARPSSRSSRASRFARPNDAASLAAAADETTGCILLEPVQGEGGIHPLTPAFLAAARALADELGALLVLDEVQTGMGRTGTFFCFEQLGVRPDAVTLAKGLANGLPIGCLLVADELGAARSSPATTAARSAATRSRARRPSPSATRSTTSCSPVVRATGALLARGLAKLPGVVEVRGLGLLLGAELDRPAARGRGRLPRARAARRLGGRARRCASRRR